MSDGYPSDWDTRRKDVYQRDDYTCKNCGAMGGSRGNAELHAHHIVPKSKGGTHKRSNLKTMCSECHKAIHGDAQAPTAQLTGHQETNSPASDAAVVAVSAVLAVALPAIYAAATYPLVLLAGVIVISLVFVAAGMTLIPLAFFISSSIFIGIIQYGKEKGSGGMVN